MRNIDDSNSIRKRMRALLVEAAESYTDNRLEAYKAALRWAQWQLARSGDVPMLIHLGKQHLGQQDTLIVEHVRKTALGSEPPHQVEAIVSSIELPVPGG